jgi:hypothetical protein
MKASYSIVPRALGRRGVGAEERALDPAKRAVMNTVNAPDR